MGYSSDLTDKEWEDHPSRYYYPKRRKLDRQPGQNENSSMASFTNSRMAVIGQTYPEIYRQIQRSSGTTKTGVRTALWNGLRHNYMVKCANKSKKTAVDDLNHD